MKRVAMVAGALGAVMAFGPAVWAQTPAPSDKDRMMEKEKMEKDKMMDKSGAKPMDKGNMDKGKAMEKDKMQDKGMAQDKDKMMEKKQ